MTIKKKREAIEKYCNEHDCGEEGNCKLYFFGDNSRNCYSSATDEEIEENYAYLFGSEVDHPSHYKGEKYECIEVMIEIYGVEFVRDWCLGNAFKYLWRCQKKHDNAVTDIKKAKFYLEKYIELEEGEANMNGE